jgi:hypothetical protein
MADEREHPTFNVQLPTKTFSRLTFLDTGRRYCLPCEKFSCYGVGKLLSGMEFLLRKGFAMTCVREQRALPVVGEALQREVCRWH